MMRDECHPERHPPVPEGALLEDFCGPIRHWAAQLHADGRPGPVRFSWRIRIGG
jgi:hypothetical protein